MTPSIRIHYGAGSRTASVDGRVFDMNAMDGHTYRRFRRLLVEGWAVARQPKPRRPRRSRSRNSRRTNA